MNVTSSDWLIEKNKLIQNRIAIRIAANQNHGIRPVSDGDKSSVPPKNHVIQHNELRENVIGVELEKAIETQMIQNISENLVADLKED